MVAHHPLIAQAGLQSRHRLAGVRYRSVLVAVCWPLEQSGRRLLAACYAASGKLVAGKRNRKLLASILMVQASGKPIMTEKAPPFWKHIVMSEQLPGPMLARGAVTRSPKDGTRAEREPSTLVATRDYYPEGSDAVGLFPRPCRCIRTAAFRISAELQYHRGFTQSRNPCVETECSSVHGHQGSFFRLKPVSSTCYVKGGEVSSSEGRA